MGRDRDRERRQQPANVLLALPDDASKDLEYGCRCIRAYYSVFWGTYLSLRGHSFMGVAKAYDRPESARTRYCIWYELYKYAESQQLNPLWCLDFAMRECINAGRDINLRSSMDKAKRDAHRSHGELLAHERVSSLTAGITSMEAIVSDYRFIHNMTTNGATIAACDQVKPDKILRLVLLDKCGIEMEKPDVLHCRLLYAGSPQAYILTDELLRKYMLVDYFKWAKIDVTAVDLRSV